MPFSSKRHLSGKKNGSLRRCAEELRRAQQLHEQLPPRISCDVPSLIAVDRPAREPEARTMASHGWATAARLFPHEAVVAEEGSSVSTLQCRTPPLACGVSRSVPPSLEARSVLQRQCERGGGEGCEAARLQRPPAGPSGTAITPREMRDHPENVCRPQTDGLKKSYSATDFPSRPTRRLTGPAFGGVKSCGRPLGRCHRPRSSRPCASLGTMDM